MPACSAAAGPQSSPTADTRLRTSPTIRASAAGPFCKGSWYSVGRLEDLPAAPRCGQRRLPRRPMPERAGPHLAPAAGPVLAGTQWCGAGVDTDAQPQPEQPRVRGPRRNRGSHRASARPAPARTPEVDRPHRPAGAHTLMQAGMTLHHGTDQGGKGKRPPAAPCLVNETIRTAVPIAPSPGAACRDR